MKLVPSLLVIVCGFTSASFGLNLTISNRTGFVLNNCTLAIYNANRMVFPLLNSETLSTHASKELTIPDGSFNEADDFDMLALSCVDYLGEVHWTRLLRFDELFKLYDKELNQEVDSPPVDLYPAYLSIHGNLAKCIPNSHNPNPSNAREPFQLYYSRFKEFRLSSDKLVASKHPKQF